MIFNTLGYFFLFLLPAALLFRIAGERSKPWICIGFGAAFFIYFSIRDVGGYAGAACLIVFLWGTVSKPRLS
jgi:alginate O-acetyltransferase complex protein AlgI